MFCKQKHMSFNCFTEEIQVYRVQHIAYLLSYEDSLKSKSLVHGSDVGLLTLILESTPILPFLLLSQSMIESLRISVSNLIYALIC